jgi:segregation and condensation protein B
MENQIQSLNLTNIIESLIFAADKPLTAMQICEIVNTPCEDTDKIDHIKNTLMREAIPAENEEEEQKEQEEQEEQKEQEQEMELSEEANEEIEKEAQEDSNSEETVEPIEEPVEEITENLHETATEETLEAAEADTVRDEDIEPEEDDEHTETEEEKKIKDEMLDSLFSIEDVLESVETIKLKYNSLSDTPIRLCEIGDAYQLRTNPFYGKFIRNLKVAKPVKLTKSALETLAILAYKQPITRTEIDAIRGVDSGYSIRFLSEKKLCKILGKKDIPGRPILYGTTDEFLSLFSLKNLSSLPTIREFKELTEKHSEKVNDLFVPQPSMDELKDKAEEIQRFTEADDANIAEIDQALSESRKVQTVEKIMAHEIMQDPKEEGEEGGEEGEELENAEGNNVEENIHTQNDNEDEAPLEAASELNEQNMEMDNSSDETEELEASDMDEQDLEDDDTPEDYEEEELREVDDPELKNVIEAYTAPIENYTSARLTNEFTDPEDKKEISDSDLYEKEVLDQIEDSFEEETEEIDRDASEPESVQQEDEKTDDQEITR